MRFFLLKKFLSYDLSFESSSLPTLFEKRNIVLGSSLKRTFQFTKGNSRLNGGKRRNVTKVCIGTLKFVFWRFKSRFNARSSSYFVQLTFRYLANPFCEDERVYFESVRVLQQLRRSEFEAAGYESSQIESKLIYFTEKSDVYELIPKTKLGYLQKCLETVIHWASRRTRQNIILFRRGRTRWRNWKFVSSYRIFP